MKKIISLLLVMSITLSILQPSLVSAEENNTVVNTKIQKTLI